MNIARLVEEGKIEDALKELHEKNPEAFKELLKAVLTEARYPEIVEGLIEVLNAGSEDLAYELVIQDSETAGYFAEDILKNLEDSEREEVIGRLKESGYLD